MDWYQTRIKEHFARYVALQPEEEVAYLDLFRYQEARKKAYILQTAQPNRYLYFVITGCLRSFIIDHSGKEVNLDFAIQNYWISDIAHNQPALLTIQALEDTAYAVLDSNQFEELTQQFPVFNLLFRKMIQNGYFAFKKRMLSLMTQTAAENYRDFLLKFPDLPQRIPQYHIASYLGVTPEFFSIIKSEGLDLYRAAIS